MEHSIKLITRSNDNLQHHCSSIAEDDDGYWITYYYGRECSDDQRVTVGFAKDPGIILEYKDFDYLTGNPIVWCFEGQVYLMYSFFTDETEDGAKIEYGGGLVERWKNCRNYLAKLNYRNGNIECEELGEIPGSYGLLARCQPLVEDGRVLIPLYRESNPVCKIWEFNGGKLFELSEFGGVFDGCVEMLERDHLSFGNLGYGYAIQPSLTSHEGRYLAFCRNVCRPFSNNTKRNSWVFKSDDCLIWYGPYTSGIPNHNNSLVVSGDYVVFNTNKYRSDIWLYNFKTKRRVSLNYQISGYRNSFSYPNMMWDQWGNLHIVHTNCNISIAWHTLDRKLLGSFV